MSLLFSSYLREAMLSRLEDYFVMNTVRQSEEHGVVVDNEVSG